MRERERQTTGETATATAVHSAQKKQQHKIKMGGKGAWRSNRGREEICV